MKKKIISVVLAVSLLAPITANAGFLKTMVESWGFTLTLTANDMLDLFGALADDIGEMGDRIIVMAGQIDLMADKILVMADKIVATEVIMADLVVDIAEIKTNTSNTCVEGIFISNELQDTLYSGDVPVFTMSATPAEYVVYVSSSLTMDTNTISVLVHNQAELEALWPTLVVLAQNGKIHLAVKSITNNTITSLSNIITYNVL